MAEHETDTIGSRINMVRKGHGLKQTQLAERLGVSPSYVSQLEGHDRQKEPSDKLIKNFCSQFKINEEWLRTGNGPKEKLEEAQSGGGFLHKYEITEEMLKMFPELHHLLLHAEEEDREGFDLQLELLAKLKAKEKGDQNSKWDGMERREGTKKSQAA